MYACPEFVRLMSVLCPPIYFFSPVVSSSLVLLFYRKVFLDRIQPKNSSYHPTFYFSNLFIVQSTFGKIQQHAHMKKSLSFIAIITFSLTSLQLQSQNVGIGTNTPTNRLTVAGKANIIDSLGIGIASPQSVLDVRGGALFRGLNNNTFATGPLRSGVEFFLGRTSSGLNTTNQNTSDMAFNWGGAGGGFRHFMQTRHDIVPGNGNAMEFYINNGASGENSTLPGVGNDLKLSITGSGVGMGIRNPNTSAVLELASPNKGLLLPRINDTTAIASPTAGLLVYDRASNSPNFYDGARWQSMNNATSSTNVTPDSITYRITAPNGVFLTAGTSYKALSVEDFGDRPTTISGGIFIGSNPNISGISLSKNFDVNSIGFKRALVAGNTNAGNIEFFVFTPGSATPYYSIKLTNWLVSDFRSISNPTDGKTVESYFLRALIIGFRNVTTNTSFSYNMANNTIGNY